MIEYSGRDKRMHDDEGLVKYHLRNTDLRQTLVMGLVSGDLGGTSEIGGQPISVVKISKLRVALVRTQQCL